jgi:hypothetical protein
LRASILLKRKKTAWRFAVLFLFAAASALLSELLRRQCMRSIKYLASFAAFALVFLLSNAAFAKDTNHGNFDLSRPARVGSTELKAGHYKAEWTGPQDALQVSIMQDGKIVATTQGKLKQLQQPWPSDSVVLRTLSNNDQRVDEIDFGNHKEALVLAGA